MQAASEAAAPPSGAPPLPATTVHAVFQSRAIETPYHLAGTGAPVLLLGSGALADPILRSVFHALADGFRVLAPELPDEGGGPARASAPGAAAQGWLTDLMDGLGMIRPPIVADPTFAALALELALADREQVGPLVLVQHGAAGLDPGNAGREDQLRRSGHPLLVLRVGPLTGSDAIPSTADTLVRFLADPGGAGEGAQQRSSWTSARRSPESAQAAREPIAPQ